MSSGIIFDVLVVLAVAVLLGEIFEQIRLPSVAGELAAGLIIGPTVLNLVQSSAQSEALSSISLFFIILYIGFQMKTEIVRKHLAEALTVSLTSFVIPLILVTVIVIALFPFGELESFITAIALAVPSISIVSVMVMQYELLEEKTGQLILSSVIITDIVALVLLATVSESVGKTLTLLLFLGIFLAAFEVVDRVLNMKSEAFQGFLRRAGMSLKREYVEYALLIVIGLAISMLFQLIGLSYIVGAFFAGLILHEELIGHEPFLKFSTTLSSINQSFFIPVFFGFAGVEATLAAADYSLLFPLLLAVVASLGSAIPLTYAVTRWGLREPSESDPRTISVMLGGRGAVGIVIVTLGLQMGLISSEAYSLVIFSTTIVSVAVPALLRRK